MSEDLHSYLFQKDDIEIEPYCPICKNANANLLFSFHPYNVFRCNKCGSGYLSPRLKKGIAEKLYRETYFTSSDSKSCGYSDYAALELLHKKNFLRRYKLVQPLVNKENVLDIGCAFGFSLDVLKKDFANCFGLDLSSEAIKKIKEKGHHGFCGDLYSCPWDNETFDFISCCETIEHIYDPLKFVKKIMTLLRRGGYAMFVTPDIDSLLSRISGKGWVSFKIPEHILYFNRSSMTYLLKSAGFSILSYRTDYQSYPARLIFERLNKAFPFFKWTFNSLSNLKPISTLNLTIPNGMFVVVARKH